MIKRIDTPYGRAYAYGSGHEAVLMPSVTTILSSEPSPYLDDLEKKIGKEELKRISDRAANRGTAMHRFLENYFICLQKTEDKEKSLLYSQKKTPEDLRKSMIGEDKISWGRDLFYNFIHEGIFEQVGKVLHTEQFLYSIYNLFAGTTDFVFQNSEGGIVIADFKSASGIRGEDVLKKYKKQLAAYTIAYEEINNREISNAQVWISHPEGLQIETISGESMANTKKDFLSLCQNFHESWDVAPIREYYIKHYVTR